MKLKSVTLRNFKGIEELKLPFDEKTTILFGVNGVGKSTILRAIDLIYANIISRLTNSNKKLAQLDYDDISHGKSRATISVIFSFEDGTEIQYNRSIDRAKARTHKIKELKELTEKFEDSYLVKGHDDGKGNWIEEEDNKNMPVFVNYGVNRLVLDVPLRVSNKEQFTKLSAFDKAIESTIDFRNLFKWFRNQEDIENQVRVRENPDYKDKSLTAVKKAMLTMLDGFEDIHIDRKPLAMKVKKNGKYLKINQLSDGEKCTIALFGDLARRMALANPQMENPLEGSGVVLIDELDLHMHPSWQRKVLRVLRETFPNIQFIITTHSPQILGEGDNLFNLFYLYRDEKNETVELKIYKSFMGWDANMILEDVMNTTSLNREVKEMRDRVFVYIENKQYDEAENLVDLLEEKTDGYLEKLTKARMLISRGRRREKNS